MHRKQVCRSAFTLIELVVVIIIIAILAAVAVPRFYDRADDAREAASLQSLSTLRGAIELYRADTGGYPAPLNTQVITYLKGPFPAVNILTSSSSAVKTVTANAALTSGDVDNVGGWLYNSTTGELRINLTSHFAY